MTASWTRLLRRAQAGRLAWAGHGFGQTLLPAVTLSTPQGFRYSDPLL
jgi:hypothetical protein